MDAEPLHSFQCPMKKWGCSLCKERGPKPTPAWALPCFVCKEPLLCWGVSDTIVIKCRKCKGSYHAHCQDVSKKEAIDNNFKFTCMQCFYDLPPRIMTLKQYEMMDPEDIEFWTRLNAKRRKVGKVGI